MILDEAYFEYAQFIKDYPDSMFYRYDNVITLRTFSKIYGLAGLRIGYGFAHEGLIANLMKVKLPFEPSILAQAAAIAALEDEKHLNESVKINREGMKYLYHEFDKLNINVNDVRSMIENKFVEYDHLSDSRSSFKHGHKYKLKSIDIKSNMPTYLTENIEKYKDWFDFDFKNI